jgi:nucleotide-binding universal stress UspA family protein
MTERILVASDGRSSSWGALQMARLLAERDGCRVKVVAVQEPVQYAYGAMGAGTGPGPISDADPAAALRRQVEERLVEIGVSLGDMWTVHVVDGEVAPSIARAAEDMHADLVLLGLHLNTDRGWSSAQKTVSRVLHLVHVPVLAVTSGTNALPVRVVVAVDASEFSRRAADQALSFMAPGAVLHLVHVLMEPTHIDLDDVLGTWMKSYRLGIEHQMNELAAALHKRSGVRVDIHILSGGAARSVLEFSDQIGAELIAAGSHGLGFVGRLILGTVSGTIMRGAKCSVLIAPPPASAAGEIADPAEPGAIQSSSG